MTNRRELMLCLLALSAAAPGSALHADAAARTFELSIESGRIIDGRTALRVTRGDAVEIRWRSDRAITLHLHGYDIELVVEPGTAAVMRFQAYATGRFPVGVHDPSGRHRVLVHIEVHPP